MKTQWIVLSALLFALITAIFAVINVESVEVNFLFAKTQTPLILVILASTLLGGLTVFLFASIRQFKLHRKIRQMEKQLTDLTAEGDATPKYDQDASLENGPVSPAAAGSGNDSSAPAQPK